MRSALNSVYKGALSRGDVCGYRRGGLCHGMMSARDEAAIASQPQSHNNSATVMQPKARCVCVCVCTASESH